MRKYISTTTTIVRLLAVAAWLALGVTVAGCNGPNGSASRGKSTDMKPYFPQPKANFREASYAELRVALPTIAEAEYVEDDELCMTCHEAYVKAFQHNVHRGQSCEKCHGPGSRHIATRGREPDTVLSFKRMNAAQSSEVCLQCHERDACAIGSTWRTSPHAHHGVTCSNCHTSHYNVPAGTPSTQLAELESRPKLQLASYIEQQPPVDQATLRAEARSLGAITPNICYRCHSNMAQQENVAHAHQICGAAGLDCRTCHDPHGKIRQETRTDLCLKCHDQSSPTMAWHSTSHARYGVACVDCHSPHPNQNVQQLINIQHTHIQRPNRLPMSVYDPWVCFKCHSNHYAMISMPSHHPIKEGKMVCGDCHDSHGQNLANLKDVSINLVCYRCHADKQGPFAYEHPPVTENCDICHQPHGTVANNLLRQPTTFLCLRCHTGHRTSPLGPDHTNLLGDVGTTPALQTAFYTDCTQCHSQIHGSDVPSPHAPHAMVR